MDKRFEVGTVVQLISGGPKMTVTGYQEMSSGSRQLVNCRWFAGSKLEHGVLPEDALRLADEEKK